ncbi:MAG: hypothetical protein GQ575_07295 [Deltaproteobacteria bacterium]|jgi:hypothetical protein|nr:hypothetical protein [Deltaproteobacteria bacterium]
MIINHKMTACAHYGVLWNAFIIGPVDVVLRRIFIGSHANIVFHKQPVPTVHAGNNIGDLSLFHRILLHGVLLS